MKNHRSKKGDHSAAEPQPKRVPKVPKVYRKSLQNLKSLNGSSTEFSEIWPILCYFGTMIRFKPVPENIHQRIASLPDYFGVNPNIIFAYLFGGLLKERPNPLSDIDLAVYARNPKKLDYLKLFIRISKILGTDEIDLVILNKAPLALTGRILQNRRVLVDKNPFLRHKYESLILREFFDFQIKERDILKRRYGIG